MAVDTVDSLLMSLDPAVVVVTAADGDERDGCLVGFHSQASIDPLRYGIWLSKANRTYRVAKRASHLGVHLLAEHQHDLAELFGSLTGDDVDKFAALAVEPGPGGVPLLSACGRRLVLRRVDLLDDDGDHVCMIGEPVEATDAAGPFRPLRLSHVADLEPGHPAD
jgi:flavin reductase (DIM6/NTAB) family NADH-FMN oxidoreductase RutF